MDTRLRLDILAQPDDQTCGPTCLHALYRYYDDTQPLSEVIGRTKMLPTGGTLAVLLACDALRRGYAATIYTYNLRLFDPSWFKPTAGAPLREKLSAQLEAKPGDERLRIATHAYLDFLDLGGVVRFQELNRALIRDFLLRERPILTGLSATYLYDCARELGSPSRDDDVRGEPSGHFVVIAGCDALGERVLVADPLADRPGFRDHLYEVGIERLLGAIMLGVFTFDANLLILEPPPGRERSGRVAS